MGNKEQTIKQKLLDGKGYTESIVFKDLADIIDDGKLELRGMTDGELNHAKGLQFEGMDVKGTAKPGESDVKVQDTDIDMKALGGSQYLATCYIAACGLSITEQPKCDKWDTKDVKRLRPAGIVEKIARKVCEITGCMDEFYFFQTPKPAPDSNGDTGNERVLEGTERPGVDDPVGFGL